MAVMSRYIAGGVHVHGVTVPAGSCGYPNFELQGGEGVRMRFDRGLVRLVLSSCRRVIVICMSSCAACTCATCVTCV